MKKNNSKNQPMIRHASIFGTVLLSSTAILPGVTALANEATADSQAELSPDATQTDASATAKALSFLNVEGASEWTENTTPLLLTLNLEAHNTENLDTVISVSPNATVSETAEAKDVRDETGRVIGHYSVNATSNQVQLTFTEKQFTKAVVTLPVDFKTASRNQQVVAFSIGDDVVSKEVTTIANPKEETEASTEESTPVVSETSETTTEAVASTTDSSTETKEETTQSQEKETSESKPTESTESTVEESTTETKTEETIEESTTESTTDSTENSTEEKEEPKVDEKEEAEESTEESEPAPLIMPTQRFAMARVASSPQEAFIESVGAHAQSVAAENDLYASVMIAQAILESGYGTSTLSLPPNHNLFGIKGTYNGQSVTMPTQEFYGGQYVTINDAFRKYPSYRESLEDNARVLKTTSFSPGVYFYAGAWKSRTNSYADATKWLTGRYATDPSYNTKLNNLIATYNLTQYDSGSGGGNITTPVVSNPGSSSSSSSSSSTSASGTYTVKSGDTLYKISKTYGMSVQELKNLNGLSSDLIHVGQTLKIKGGSTSSSSSNTSSSSSTSSSNSSSTTASTGSTSSASTHTVKSGDTLYKISKTYGTSVQELKSLNGLSSDLIHVGQTLKLKAGATSSSSQSTSSNTASKPNTSTTVGNYTVKSGDTLYRIAMNHSMSVQELKSLNGLSSDLIRVGQSLKVKGGSTSSSSTSTSTSSTSSASTHTVKSGDTLYGIGLKYGVSVQQIKSLNNLSSDIIHVGQTLKLSKGSSATSTNTSTTASTTKTTHVVKSGDTLYGIGLRYKASISDIKKWNNLSSDVIHVGQRLSIGQSASASTVKTTATSTSTTQGSYTVKSGDTLYKIAMANKTTVQAIKQKNNLSSDFIYVGQKLTMPGATTGTVSKNARHTVKAGESLWAISQKYNTSVAQIKSWNNLSSDIIYANQVLRVS